MVSIVFMSGKYWYYIGILDLGYCICVNDVVGCWNCLLFDCLIVSEVFRRSGFLIYMNSRFRIVRIVINIVIISSCSLCLCLCFWKICFCLVDNLFFGSEVYLGFLFGNNEWI